MDLKHVVQKMEIREECYRATHTAEWKKNREKRGYGSEDISCIRCGSKKELAPHHNHRCESVEEYKSLKGTVPLCKRCHFALKHGKDKCPDCDGYKLKGRNECAKCRAKGGWANLLPHEKQIDLRERYDEYTGQFHDMGIEAFMKAHERFREKLPNDQKEIFDEYID